MPKNIRERLRAVLALCAIAVMLTGRRRALCLRRFGKRRAGGVRAAEHEGVRHERHGARVYLSSLGSRLAAGFDRGGATTAFPPRASSSPAEARSRWGSAAPPAPITLTHNGVKTNMGTSFSLRRHSASGAPTGIKISQARESNNPYPGDLTFRPFPAAAAIPLYTIANIYIENYLYACCPTRWATPPISRPSRRRPSGRAHLYRAHDAKPRFRPLRRKGHHQRSGISRHAVGQRQLRGCPVDATKGIVAHVRGPATSPPIIPPATGGQTRDRPLRGRPMPT